MTSILAVSLIASCSDTASYNNGNGDGVTVVFTGDVLLDRGLKPVIRRNGVEHLFRDVAPYFRQADFTVVNLECPITQIDAPLMKKYIFRADDSCAAALAKVGVTHCAMANNHIMDQGVLGLEDTYNNILKAHLSPIGYGINDSIRLLPAILEKNGVRIAIFNDCAVIVENYASPISAPGIANVPISKLIVKISAFHRQNPDTKIVALLHWGHEFRDHPESSQRMQAAQIFAAGADVIVGHHPHVIQDIDTIKGKTVYYSIGNFVFDQTTPKGRQALMPIITFKKDTVVHKVVEVEIVGNCPMVREERGVR